MDSFNGGVVLGVCVGGIAILMLAITADGCAQHSPEAGASQLCQQMGYARAVKDGDQWACEQTPERMIPKVEAR